MSRPERRRAKSKGRTPIAPRRTKRVRAAPRFDTEQWDDATMKLFARSRGMCERCGEPLNGRGERHHRRRRRDGGDRLCNLLLICRTCHAFITDQPESVTRARELGYIVPALAVSDVITYPVLQWGTTWVLLDDDGHATRCDDPR